MASFAGILEDLPLVSRSGNPFLFMMPLLFQCYFIFFLHSFNTMLFNSPILSIYWRFKDNLLHVLGLFSDTFYSTLDSRFREFSLQIFNRCPASVAWQIIYPGRSVNHQTASGLWQCWSLRVTTYFFSRTWQFFQSVYHMLPKLWEYGIFLILLRLLPIGYKKLVITSSWWFLFTWPPIPDFAASIFDRS